MRCIALVAALFITAAPSMAAVAQPTPARLTAFVAANAMDPFNDLVAAFGRLHPGVIIVPEYAGTQVLETQAEHGAPFDLFLSADRAHAQRLAEEHLIATPVPVSMNHEVLIVPPNNPAGIASLRDLGTRPARIVLGAANVPIGAYARRVLGNAAQDYGSGFLASVLARVVSNESNVKQVLLKVALGEADAGIVYNTDVTPRYAARVRLIDIPKRYLVEGTNYLAPALQSSESALARAFVAFAAGPQGRAIFARRGYDAAR